MSEQNDGGPAFPFPTHDQTGACGQGAHGGMTLRDWFAGQAIVGLLGARNGFLVDIGTKNVGVWAYEVADNVLAARQLQVTEDEEPA